MLSRPRLVRRLKTALETTDVVMVAPGGYGKSVVLRTLTTQHPNTHYFALTPADADRALLQPRLDAHINDPGSFIILDDVHHLEHDSDTIQWLDELLSFYHADRARLIVSGRRLELPNLARLTAQRKITRFERSDLAFSREESSALGISNEWHKRTEGWPLALALRQQIGTQLANTSVDSIASESATTQLIDELARSLFAGLPDQLQRFLQISAVPLRVNAELAADLLGVTPLETSALLREVLRRNLFLEESDPRGWYRYHDLIRDYLLRQYDPTAIFKATVDWFGERDDPAMAIEHALDGKLFTLANDLLEQIPGNVVWSGGRTATFKRWILSLPDEILRQNPKQLARLGREIGDIGLYEESWDYLNRALTYAQDHPDSNTRAFVKRAVAANHYTHDQFEASTRLLYEALAENDLLPHIQQYIYNSLGNVLAYQHRLADARPAYEASLALAEKEGDEAQICQVKHNLNFLVYQPLGQFEKAEELLRQNDHYVADKPGWRSLHLLARCGQHEAMGDWQALAETLHQMRATDALLEQASQDLTWERWYDALQAIGQGRYAEAAIILDKMKYSAKQKEEAYNCEVLARAWLYQRQGKYQQALELIAATLTDASGGPYYRGALAILYEVILIETGGNHERLRTEVQLSIQLRARPQVLRLHALLALRCHRAGDRRWRIHLNSVLRTSRRYGYEKILVTREPDLGAHFWTLCVEEGTVLDQAHSALRQIGRTDLLVRLLGHPSPATRVRAIHALADCGAETIISTLVETLNQEKDVTVRNALEVALDQLESLPPPTLRVNLLGEFSAVRGDRAITAEDWQRPAARKLFQYFVLNQGKPLPRDRILEELWHDSAPDAARSSFKTVYSWLRKAIEPYLRPKSPSRYVQVEQETYTFNPQKRMEIVYSDVTEFEKIVRGVLKETSDHDVRPMPEAFVAVLEGWNPLLPELSYEPWTLEARERLLNLYVEGCLYAASAMLDIDRSIDAASWAEQAIAAAPWSEETWQQLMRAQARQGNRSLALKTYDSAVAALKRELDAPPSSLLVWLAHKLHMNEEI